MRNHPLLSPPLSSPLPPPGKSFVLELFCTVRGRFRGPPGSGEIDELASVVAVEPLAEDDPNQIVFWVTLNHWLMGSLPIAVRVTVDDDCRITRQEDCWWGREVISIRNGGALLGTLSEVNRWILATGFVMLGYVLSSLESTRERYHRARRRKKEREEREKGEKREEGEQGEEK